MEQYVDLLQKNKLFEGIEATQLPTLLTCLSARPIEVLERQLLVVAGQPVPAIGCVLDGQLEISQEKLDGQRVLVGALAPGDFYGESLSLAGITESPVSVRAVVDSRVLLLDVQRVITVCSKVCDFHTQVISNLFRILAEKNIFLQSRLAVLSSKTIREKVIEHLSTTSPGYGMPFLLPFDRQSMADFFCVDRSALSRELARMQREGIIRYCKNEFTLLKPPVKTP